MSDCVFNFNILTLVVSEILGDPKFTLGGAMPPSTPPSGNFFVPEASTLLCLMAFLIELSSSFTFSDIRGSQLYTRGPYAPGRPLSDIFFTKSEYFTISNCVFNFNILALILSEILGGSQI